MISPKIDAALEKTKARMNSRPRILLADDHTMLLDAFQRLLEPRCEIVGTACDGRALIDLAANTRPDVIVLDIAMPGLNGIDACAQLRRKMPGIRLVFLTVNEDPDIAAEAINLGASGYLLKSSAPVELFTAIEQALAGKTYITPLVTKGMPLGVFLGQAVKPGVEKLTERQREVLQLLAEGRAMKEVADLLHVSARTVAFHKYTIMEHLGLKTSAELVQYALEHGMLKKRS
jgi:DNA-binding NarL/FixJ family response regulator